MFCVLLTAACRTTSLTTPGPTSPDASSLPLEVEVREIPLSGPASGRPAEISGMAWYGDILILLPQFPARFGENDEGAVFALKKSSVLDFLDKGSASSLEPLIIPFNDGGVSDEIRGFEGFEAIAFEGEKIYLTIESSPNQMRGYIISGSIRSNLSEIRLDPATLTEIPQPVELSNISDESLLIYKEKVITLYEANGEKVNPSAVAHQFSQLLQLQGVLPFPNLDYRVTDAAPPDQNGYFWALNDYFPLDEMKLKPQNDILAKRYGLGKTHLENLTVERLVQFQINEEEIRLVDTPPVQLRLEGDIAPRNWEAIALLDNRGFLIATDKFPRTILGFVPFELKK